MKIDALSAPYSVYLNLTERCNLKCLHCFGSYGKEGKEMDFEQWKKVIDELISCKVFYVNISGGEPTQSPHFVKIIDYMNKVGLHFILTTNGVFSESIRDAIIKARRYCIGVKISIDGYDWISHGYIRKTKSGLSNRAIFDRTMLNACYFSMKEFPMTIATVLHTKNIDHMDKMMMLIKEINPISWFVSPIVSLGRAKKNKRINQTYKEYSLEFWENLKQKARESGINIRFVDLPVQEGKKGMSSYECAGAINMCEIHSDGQVSPCSLSRVSIDKKQIEFDNIKDKRLIDIWNGKAFNEFRSYMDKGCDGCKMKSKCNKCIAQSFRYFDNGFSPTPFCVSQGKKTGLKEYSKFKSILKKRGVILS